MSISCNLFSKYSIICYYAAIIIIETKFENVELLLLPNYLISKWANCKVEFIRNHRLVKMQYFGYFISPQYKNLAQCVINRSEKIYPEDTLGEKLHSGQDFLKVTRCPDSLPTSQGNKTIKTKQCVIFSSKFFTWYYHSMAIWMLTRI